MKLVLRGLDLDGEEIFNESFNADDFYEGLWVTIGVKNGTLKLKPEDEKIYHSNSPEGLAMRKDYKRFALTDGEKAVIYDEASDSEKTFLEITRSDSVGFTGPGLEDLYSKMDSESPGIIADIYNVLSDNIKAIRKANGLIIFNKVK